MTKNKSPKYMKIFGIEVHPLLLLLFAVAWFISPLDDVPFINFLGPLVLADDVYFAFRALESIKRGSR